HILLVEDHPDTAAAMADLLRGIGHRVTTAASVEAALAAAAAVERQGGNGGGGGIDLVVSDLGLPDGSGYDLMRELARRYGLRGIALSGYGMEDDVQQSREAGFERHLTKPVDLRSLDAAIREASQVAVP
ncbi:MAG TPA: response regulator, partial [Thermoanaerobaculia bacterium]